MNGCFLLIPFLLIRFYLLSKSHQNGIKRAAHFPKMQGNEVFAYWIYQVSNVAIFIYLCFTNVLFQDSWYIGMIVYVAGLLLCAASIVGFAHPNTSGLNTNGIYKYSRNPMYVSYFLIFIGCSLLTNSLILFILTIVFQVSSHWIILAEERWCMGTFAQAYSEYMLEVRRYL